MTTKYWKVIMRKIPYLFAILILIIIFTGWWKHSRNEQYIDQALYTFPIEGYTIESDIFKLSTRAVITLQDGRPVKVAFQVLLDKITERDLLDVFISAKLDDEFIPYLTDPKPTFHPHNRRESLDFVRDGYPGIRFGRIDEITVISLDKLLELCRKPIKVKIVIQGHTYLLTSHPQIETKDP